MSTSNLLQPSCLSSTQRSASPSSSKIPAVYTRIRQAQYHTFDHAVDLLKSSSNIIVLTGAGISTSIGIRDFRSQEGVHSILRRKGFDSPEELFHIQTFEDDPELFYDTLELILPPVDVPFSPTHAFVRLLQDKNKLLCNYTQNIDGLEGQAGIEKSKIIQCHGGLAPGVCVTCGHRVKARYFLPAIRRRIGAPRCKYCCSPNGLPLAKATVKSPRNGAMKKRKRKNWEDDDDDPEDKNRGILRPSITFYGEHINDTFASRFAKDRPKVDLLLVIGTSLKVRPVSDVLVKIGPQIPQIFISKTRCTLSGVTPDIELLGECDVIVEELTRRAGWRLEHEMIPPTSEYLILVEPIIGTPSQNLVRRESKLVKEESIRPSTVEEVPLEQK